MNPNISETKFQLKIHPGIFLGMGWDENLTINFLWPYIFVCVTGFYILITKVCINVHHSLLACAPVITLYLLSNSIFTLNIGTPYLLNILVLKFEIIHSANSRCV